MKRVQELFWSIIGNIASNFLWVPIASSLLPLLALWVAQIGQVLEMPWVGRGFGISWFITWFIAAVWYRNNRANTYKRLVSLGSMLFLSDVTLRRLFVGTQNRRSLRLSEQEIRIEIEQLLSGMCSIIAYRIESVQKGGTFLLYKDDPANPGDGYFELFAHHNHNNTNVAYVIKERVRKHNSLAGQALEKDRLLVYRDCRIPTPGVNWVDTANPRNYIGRAVAPVRKTDTAHKQFIGVVCFDIKRPWTITNEEEDIINLVADKIGHLWSFHQ